jgi:ribosomal protein L32
MSAVNEFYNLKSMLSLTESERENMKKAKESKKKPVILNGFKTCKICGEYKPFTEFYVSTTTKDGMHHACIKCMREKARQKYAESKRQRC